MNRGTDIYFFLLITISMCILVGLGLISGQLDKLIQPTIPDTDLHKKWCISHDMNRAYMSPEEYSAIKKECDPLFTSGNYKIYEDGEVIVLIEDGKMGILNQINI